MQGQVTVLPRRLLLTILRGLGHAPPHDVLFNWTLLGVLRFFIWWR